MTQISEFFEAMKRFVPDDARIMYSQFRCQPHENVQGKWTAKILNNTEIIDDGANVYFCVSAMRKHPQNGWHRRKENFAGGLLLMIDDVGDGPGSKFPLDKLDALMPTALIETSPGNHQAIYMFDRIITDELAFDALINAFVKVKFLDSDTGMKGVVRVFRPPVGVNSKPAYMKDGRPWRVQLKAWHPENRYSYEAICEAFELNPVRVAQVKRHIHVGEATMHLEAFKVVYKTLQQSGMIKGLDDQQHDWVHITCPWVDNHTGRVNNGAGLTIPSEVNQFYGGFKCWHGSCEGKTWGDLTDHLSEIYEDLCNKANEEGAEHDGLS